MFIKYFKTEKGGYTILETMIAVSIFLVIMTTGMGALLNANVVHRKSQDLRSGLDNLSFVIDDISKNMRTGYSFHCITNTGSLGDLTVPLSGQNCWGVAFRASDGNTWAYKVDDFGSNGNYDISKSIDGGINWIVLNPVDEIKMDNSGTIFPFSVLGAEGLAAGNQQQPLAVVRLVGKITYKSVDTPFSFQTSVSQRLIDN